MAGRWNRVAADGKLAPHRLHVVSSTGTLVPLLLPSEVGSTTPEDPGGGGTPTNVLARDSFDGPDGIHANWRNPTVITDNWYNEHTESPFYRSANQGRMDGSLDGGQFRTYHQLNISGDYRVTMDVRTTLIRSSGNSIVPGFKVWPKRIEHPDLIAAGYTGGKRVIALASVGLYALFVHTPGYGELSKKYQDSSAYSRVGASWNRPCPIGTSEPFEMLVEHLRSPDRLRVRMYLSGQLVADRTDGNSPMMGPAHFGLRADYTDTYVDNFLLEQA